MYKNNFDCSSSGLNIEVSACYDSSAARVIYDDAYVTYYAKHGRDVSLCVRTYDFYPDNIPSTAGEVGSFNRGGKRGPLPKDIMCEILNEYREYSYDTESFTYQELKDELNLIDIRYVPDLLTYYGKFYSLNDDIDLYVSKGYCQGDVANVLAKKETIKNYHHLIDNELWDCPVTASIIISGCEYDYYDFDCAQYVWEKEKFIDGVVKAHTNNLELQGRIKAQLEVMLPDELEVV